MQTTAYAQQLRDRVATVNPFINDSKRVRGKRGCDPNEQFDVSGMNKFFDPDSIKAVIEFRAGGKVGDQEYAKLCVAAIHYRSMYAIVSAGIERLTMQMLAKLPDGVDRIQWVADREEIFQQVRREPISQNIEGSPGYAFNYYFGHDFSFNFYNMRDMLTHHCGVDWTAKIVDPACVEWKGLWEDPEPPPTTTMETIMLLADEENVKDIIAVILEHRILVEFWIREGDKWITGESHPDIQKQRRETLYKFFRSKVADLDHGIHDRALRYFCGLPVH